MANNPVVRFPGHLDPTAQEFRPSFPTPFLSPPPFYPVPPPEFIYPPHPLLQPPSYIPPSMPPPASAPTRALLLSAVPHDVSESCVRRELEVFGDVRAVQMERVREGIVIVHFYDLRAAHAALSAVRDQHMQHQHRLRAHFSNLFGHNYNYHLSAGLPLPCPPPAPGLVSGRVVWAQFTIPVTHAFPDGHNQGTLVIFNLDPDVTAPALKDIFDVFGPVKELRETPFKRQQRFVEFYDVRDAAKALAEMNSKEINGRSVMIEYSRPGGHNNKKYFHTNHYQHRNSNHSSDFYNHHNVSKRVQQRSPPPQPQQQQLVRALPFRNRRTSPRQQQVRRRRRNSPSSEESIEVAMSGLMTMRTSSENERSSRGSNSNVGGEERNDGVNKKGNESESENSWSSSKQLQQQKGRPYRRQKNFDPKYLIKEDAIIDGSVKDTRTTVMIKNIPNKYSQKLLLNMLDNHCIHSNEKISAAGDDQPLSSYDFLYLPIDFNNKCNVGYGFVNMTSPEATLRLYKSFHHQHWEVFNSRKICEVTYARVQGLEALKDHFKNSKFACENDEYLPVVFNPPRDGRHLAAPLPIVFSNIVPSSPTSIRLLHSNIDIIDSGDITSTTTSTITVPSSSGDFDHDHDEHHLTIMSRFNSMHISEDDGDHDEECRSSLEGGGDVINVDDEDMHMDGRSSSNSSNS